MDGEWVLGYIEETRAVDATIGVILCSLAGPSSFT